MRERHLHLIDKDFPLIQATLKFMSELYPTNCMLEILFLLLRLASFMDLSFPSQIKSNLRGLEAYFDDIVDK